MKHKIILLLLIPQLLLQAQSDFEVYLQSIEANNKTLLAARKLAEAEQLSAKTGIYLENPEISYDYLNGNNENYSEMVVSQAFDFPTAYSHRNKIADINELQANEQYLGLRLNTLNEAVESYARQIIAIRKLNMLRELDSMLYRLQANAERKLELGDANILETNRIRTESAKNKVEVNLLLTNTEALKQKIKTLNGGNDYSVTGTEVISIRLPVITDSVIQQVVKRHPTYSFWNGELNKSEYEIKLQKANSLPKFELGYRQDQSNAGTFNGISAGMSIPLFENKNTVKRAKAQQAYAIEEMWAKQLTIEIELKKLAKEYAIVSSALMEIEEMIAGQNTPGLLIKAYEAGQINYTEFFSEYSSYKTTQLYIEDIRLKTYLLEMKLYLYTMI